MERNELTLRGLPTNPGYGAEVSRGHSKPETSCARVVEVSQKDEGLNVRMVTQTESL